MNAADVWAYITSAGPAGVCLDDALHDAGEVHRLHGLGGDALVTDATSRTAGTILQTIAETPGPTITVTRTP